MSALTFTDEQIGEALKRSQIPADVRAQAAKAAPEWRRALRRRVGQDYVDVCFEADVMQANWRDWRVIGVIDQEQQSRNGCEWQVVLERADSGAIYLIHQVGIADRRNEVVWLAELAAALLIFTVIGEL